MLGFKLMQIAVILVAVNRLMSEVIKEHLTEQTLKMLDSYIKIDKNKNHHRNRNPYLVLRVIIKRHFPDQ